MEQALAESIAPRRFNLLLLGTFALVALVLAVLGVYGVVAYAVAERTQEIGIRLALGAERARVVRMIVSQGMLSVVAGIAGGLIVAYAATRLIAGLLYGVGARRADLRDRHAAARRGRVHRVRRAGVESGAGGSGDCVRAE